MKRKVKVNFLYFWSDFSLADFEEALPCVMEHYDLELSSEPDVVFYCTGTPNAPEQRIHDGQYVYRMPILPTGHFLRVFINAENVESCANQDPGASPHHCVGSTV